MRPLARALIALALLPADTRAQAVNRARYLMGTVCEVSVTGAQDANAEIARAFDEAKRVEQLISTWRTDSELSRVNRGARPSPELEALLETVESWREKTGGAFEPRIRPLIDAWQTRDSGAVPDPRTIAESLEAIRSRNAPVEEGAFGKGYAIDRMLNAIEAPAAVINFGGQLGVRGISEATVADPKNRSRAVIAFTIANASLSTSGGSEHTFRIDGRHFTHLIDPHSGQALPEHGSVSVVASDALSADILSTALFVMGPADGLRWANEHDVAALFIDTENHISFSSSFRALARDIRLLDRDLSAKD